MTGPGTNTYVVGDDAVVVLDPGPPIASHLDVVLGVVAGRPVTAVAVTHHHRDHAPAARSLAAAVGAPVVGTATPSSPSTSRRARGSELAAGTLGLVAWHTPGHASDHLCFLVPSTGWLFTGDHLMQGSTVVIRPPDGDLTAYLDSVARVRDDGRVRRLAPGHGRMLAAPARAATEVLEHRAARGEVVLEALREHGPCDRGIAARLRLSRRRPRARRSGDGDVLGAPAGTRRRRPRDVGLGALRPRGRLPDRLTRSSRPRGRARRAGVPCSPARQAAARARRPPASRARRNTVAGRPVGQGDRSALVGVGTERGVERHRRQELDAQLRAEPLAAARAEQRRSSCRARTRTSSCSRSRPSSRRFARRARSPARAATSCAASGGVVTSSEARLGQRAREPHRDVARPGRQVDEQVVDPRPVRVLDELLDGLVEDEPAPQERLVLLSEEAHRHDAQLAGADDERLRHEPAAPRLERAVRSRGAAAARSRRRRRR